MIKTWLAGFLLLIAAPLHAQMIPFDAEVGFRWFDVSGNEGMYRTQINERSGFLIRRLTINTGDIVSVVDRFRIDVSDLGTGPAGSLRLEADRAGAYRLRLAYRGTEAFSELPAFANPLLAQGVVLGQHTYDRTRRMFDVDLDILPDAAFSPFIGYTFNDSDSDGTTTYNVGQDEFLLGQDLAEQDRELRLGASFRFANVYGRVTQGWRSFEGTETLALGSGAGAGAGNNPGSVRGQPVTANTIVRTSDIDGSTPFTNLFVTGRFANRIQATATFVRFAAESDSSEDENASGNFASFALGRFYRGLESSVASRAQNDTWRGGARVEATIVPNVDVAAGFEREHSDITGSALVQTLFLQSITFGGADARDLATVLDATSGLEREEDVFHVTAAASAVGPFSFRAEFRNTAQDVTIAPDVAEIVVPGAQGGTFERQIRTFDVSASFSRSRLNVGLAWRHDTADDPIFRTDFLDRDRIRLRASWSTPNDMFRAGLTAEDLDQSNDGTGIGYDAETRQYSADLEFAPIAMLRLRGAFSEFETESHVLIRRPENFNVEESVHLEDGQSIEAGILFQRATLSIDAGMTRFENEGTLPFDLDRLRLRVAYDFKTRYGIAFEWNRDEYSEAAALGDYEAARYGLYLRLRP